MPSSALAIASIRVAVLGLPWRRIATRYDRCATTFFGAITLAVTAAFWLGQ